MAKTNNLGDFLKDVADGIRTARGATGSIAAQNFRTEIEKLKPANYISVTIDGVPQTSNLAFTSSLFYEELGNLSGITTNFFIHNGLLCRNQLGTTHQYNKATNTWTQLTSFGSSTAFSGWNYISSINGTLVVIGNQRSTTQTLRSAYYNGSSWSTYVTNDSIYGKTAQLVVYNNELYLVGAYNPTTYKYEIHKWNGTQFVSVISDIFKTNVQTSYPPTAYCTVHNGKIHIILGVYGYYATFDGTNIVNKTTTSAITALVSYDGKLYSFINADQYIYNDSDNSWTMVYQLGGSFIVRPIVYENKIHAANINSPWTHYISNKNYTLIE